MRGWFRRVTHCAQGHPFDEANTYVTSEGWQACRECHRRWRRKRYERQKENNR